MEFFKIFQSCQLRILRLCQKMKETFSLIHDMAEDVGNGGKLLKEQHSLVET